MNLTNFSRDKKAGPVYMRIGILLLTIGNRPGSIAILLLGLLPMPPKLAKASGANNLFRLINADTVCGLFGLSFAQLNTVRREGAPIDCSDGKIRKYFPIMAGWIAEHMENVTLHEIKSNTSPECELPPEELASRAGYHCARYYTRYERYERDNLSLDSETHHTAHAR